jgi:hypothetical protein
MQKNDCDCGRRSRHHFETRTCLGEDKTLGHNFEETEARNECAGEDQQQFNHKRKTEERSTANNQRLVKKYNLFATVVTSRLCELVLQLFVV